MFENRVSVIVPTRDNLDLLPKAYESIRAQNITDIEIIIADDGSTDGTQAWLKKQMDIEPRLRVLETGGKGPANARNKAIAAAKTPFIAFLDADDWWHPGKLKWQVAYLEQNPHVGFSFTDYVHVDPDGKTHGTCYDFWRPSYGNRPPQGYDLLDNAEQELLACNTAGTSTVLARTDLLIEANGFSTDLQSAEDWDLWLRLAHRAPVASTSIIGTSYLMRPNSESTRKNDRLAAMQIITDRYRLNKDPLFRLAIKRADARIYAAKADMARSKGQYWHAVAAELQAFANAPTMRDMRAAASDAAHGILELVGRLGEKNQIKKQDTGYKKAA